MIVYRLVCDQKHQFEGWFQSIEDYDRQSEEGAILCPMCESLLVSRLPSAPHVQTGREAAPVDARRDEPIEVHKLLRMLQSITEDVGGEFPNEARKIHYREVPARNIRGRASRAAIEALEDEGIDVLSLPDLSILH